MKILAEWLKTAWKLQIWHFWVKIARGTWGSKPIYWVVGVGDPSKSPPPTRANPAEITILNVM